MKPSNSIPINKTAARVISKGVNYVPPLKKVETIYFSKTPSPTTPFVGKPEHDLTGKKVGDLTVIGWIKSPNPNKNGKWLVRCACGWYEHRTGKSLKRSVFDHCRDCRKREYIRRAYQRHLTGKWEPTMIEKANQSLESEAK